MEAVSTILRESNSGPSGSVNARNYFQLAVDICEARRDAIYQRFERARSVKKDEDRHSQMHVDADYGDDDEVDADLRIEQTPLEAMLSDSRVMSRTERGARMWLDLVCACLSTIFVETRRLTEN